MRREKGNRARQQNQKPNGAAAQTPQLGKRNQPSDTQQNQGDDKKVDQLSRAGERRPMRNKGGECNRDRRTAIRKEWIDQGKVTRARHERKIGKKRQSDDRDANRQNRRTTGSGPKEANEKHRTSLGIDAKGWVEKPTKHENPCCRCRIKWSSIRSLVTQGTRTAQN